tara:strand:- start:305 stop:472 length:168 start_codon:yes stop_codon:yes gene_type:complete
MTCFAKDVCLKYSMPVVEFFQKLLVGIEKESPLPASGIRNERKKESTIIEYIKKY